MPKKQMTVTEITIVSASSALKSLENIRLFLLQQETQVNKLNSLERFGGGKSSQMKQTTIKQCFN